LSPGPRATSGPLRAALFDLDGLLVDSEPAWTRAERELLEAMGGTWSPQVKAACVGMPLDGIARALLERAPHPLPPDETTAILGYRIAELFAAGLAPKPGAQGLVRALLGRAIPTAVVSSSVRVLVETALAVFPSGSFTVIVAGDDVRRHKPDPEPYLTAARQLGVEPRHCTVFEDSPAGVESGLAAGCAVVAVPGTLPLPAYPGLTLVRSLGDFDLDGWRHGTTAEE
jgi:HAD superfamily hydrolase (TIGR01509 family)